MSVTVAMPAAVVKITRCIFLIAGFGFAAWAPLVPFARARAELSDFSLGLLLLGLGIGSLISMPLAGAACSRFGCRRTIAVSGVVMAGALPLLASFSRFESLAVALLLFGIGVGALDVSMNVQAILVERAFGRPMLSGFHGFFSLGAIAGAGWVVALLALDLSPLIAAVSVSVLMLGVLLPALPSMLPYGTSREGPLFAIPRGTVLWLGGICFIAFMAEGAILDWSAVYLQTAHGVNASWAGIGYAVFSVTMTAGRLAGDRLVQRLGSRQVVEWGALLAAVGLFGSVWAPGEGVVLVSYAILGLGLSNLAPQMFSWVGRQSDMPESAAVPAMNTLGYAGILAGPAMIGFVSHLSGLKTAFVLVAAALMAAAMVTRKFRNG